MKTKLALLAVIAGFSVAAVAQDATRQEVKSEAKAAMQQHEVGGNAPAANTAKSTKARTDVRNEARAATKTGDVGGNKPTSMATKSNRNRADVKAEAATANKAGKIATGIAN